MQNILEKIVQEKKESLAIIKKDKSLSSLEEKIKTINSFLNFKDAINNNKKVSLISEIKKASPSAGILVKDFNHLDIAKLYVDNGATCLSVLTEEKNFLGKGVSLDANFNVSSDTFKGEFGITNPNFNNTDKSIYFNLKAIETDNYNTFGYKSNKTGFDLGTNFEYYNDLRLGIGTSNFYEVIQTNSTASAAQQNQEGNYWDTFLNLDFNYDKRDQKFQTTSGFRSYYSVDLPIISENYTLSNSYNYSYYFDLFDENVSSLSIFLKSANSINDKDIKLSERVKIPSSKLRGFESGRFGPKDGDDFIGGNYGYAINFSSTIPKILEESQNVDFLFFIDAANLWGVDYDNSIDDSGSIRSSAGLALDWFSPLGPLNFSLAYPITKEDGDKEETFRFNLGTSF